MSLMSVISRSKPKHRAIDKVAELEAENEALIRQAFGAVEYIGQLELVNGCLADTARKLTEQRDAAWGERNELRAELGAARTRLAPFLAAEANANAVTVPAAIRDIGRFEDQATEPINVRPLWEAIGPVVCTDGSTDPAHLPAA
ncbi:hypothetical protein [Streptomyces bacillaris]|uniref:hypothetical protein n=1 Tax=Streptomyces bacillaris TaxID=68179 RepID=UPI003EBCC760